MKLKRIFVVLLFMLLTTMILTSCAQPERPLSAVELLDLGERYLLELNFEQALVHFTVLIEIEPMNPRGYTGAAEAHLGLGQPDEAIAILQLGLGRTEADTIRNMLDELQPTQVYEPMLELDIEYRQQREEALVNVMPVLIEIAWLISFGMYEEVFQKMHTADFEYVANFVDFLREPLIADTVYGHIGVYRIASERFGNFMLYFGGYEGYMRSGEGLWFGYHNHNNYFGRGNWANDAPNGVMVIREWHSGLAENVVYRVISGHTVNGLWHGDVTWAFEREDGITDVFAVSFDYGQWVIVEVDEDDYGDMRYIGGFRIEPYADGQFMTVVNPHILQGVEGFRPDVDIGAMSEETENLEEEDLGQIALQLWYLLLDEQRDMLNRLEIAADNFDYGTISSIMTSTAFVNFYTEHVELSEVDGFPRGSVAYMRDEEGSRVITILQGHAHSPDTKIISWGRHVANGIVVTIQHSIPADGSQIFYINHHTAVDSVPNGPFRNIGYVHPNPNVNVNFTEGTFVDGLRHGTVTNGCIYGTWLSNTSQWEHGVRIDSY